MVLHFGEWQQVGNMCSFENCRNRVTAFLKSTNIYMYYFCVAIVHV